MKRFISVLLVAILLLTTAAPLSYAAEDAPSLEEKAQAISDVLVSAFGASSVQYALIDSGSIVLSGGSGAADYSAGSAVENDDVFAIGSVSKLYVTAAVMALVDKGLIGIDNPLTTYIPEFKMADERYQQISPRMLMNHSSGIYGTHFSGAYLFDDNDTKNHDSLLSNLETQILKSTPGEISEYCNDGFTLLEILVERVSGISYTEFIAKHFSEPLGLERTKTPLDVFDKNKIVKAYSPLYNGALPVGMTNMIGTGGLFSTAEEMCKFAEVLMGKKPEILSEKSALAMQNEEYKNGMWLDDGGENAVAYGLGWDTVNDYPFGKYNIKALAKDGSTRLFNSILVALPEHNIAMAVVSSGGISVLNHMLAVNIIQEHLLENGIIDEIIAPKDISAPQQTTMPAELQRFSGLYAASGGQMSVEFENDELVLLPVGYGAEFEERYIYSGNGEFKSGDGTAELKFLEQQDGTVFLQVKMYINIPGIGQFVSAYFSSQRLTPQELSEDVADAWLSRAGRLYYIVNEKHSSQLYLMGDFMPIDLGADFSSGFAYGGARIVDANCAVNTLKLREAADLEFYTENGIEYLRSRGFVYVGDNNIPEIYDGNSSVCTIQPSGFARYYKIGETTQGCKMSVDIPNNAAFAVYDETGACVNFTGVSQDDTVVLPANGIIVFVGDVGTVFKIAIE